MEPSTRTLKIDIAGLIEREPAYITTFHEFGRFIVSDTLENLRTIDSGNSDKADAEFFVSTSEDMVSEEVKVLIPVEDTFYHFFIDSLPALLKLHKQDPSILFVLYLQKARPNPAYEKFLSLLFRILDSINIKYKLIPTVVGMDFAPVYRISNYVLIDQRINIHEVLTFVDIQYSVALAFKAARDDKWDEADLDPPFRKIYLTRGGKGGNLGPIPEDYEFYRDDLRMYEEEKLEKFFSDLGYEIVDPETKFDSIMEQIFYMREVKTLVSVTCSGLANMIFMQPGQTIIELQAELVQIPANATGNKLIPKQNLHNFYQPLSFMGEHTYIGVPSRRDPEKVIEILSKDAISYVL
jgi:hypothetical protein